MIVYKKADLALIIPCGLGTVVCPDTGHDLQMKQVDSSTVSQDVTPDTSYFGLYRVIVNPYELDSKTVDSSTEPQVITSSKDGLFEVIVNPYTLEDKSDSITENGQYTYYPTTADGMAQVTIDVSVDTVNNQTKTVDSSTTIQYVQPDNGYTGLEYVAVNPYVLDTKTVNPSTGSQTVTSDEDGMSSVTVNPVTAAIDPDIVSSNIKKDVDILGVVGTFEGGTLQSKTVDSSTTSQTITPDGVNYGLSSVTVNPYTEEAVSDTITQNGQYTYTAQSADTLSGVTIDVSVADIPAVIQTKSVTYTQNGEYTVTKDTGYDGMSSVDISVNIAVPQPVMQTKTVDSSTSDQTVTPDQNYDGLSSVTVNAYTLENKTVDSSTSQQTISADNGYNGLNMVTVNPYTLDSKTVDSSTVSQTVTSSQDGLSSVTVNPYVLDNKTVDSSTVSQIITSDEDGLSSVTVNPYVLDTKTVDSSTVSQTITSDEDGLSSVTVNPYTTETRNASISTNGTFTYTPVSADALSEVTIDVSINTVNNQAKTVDSSTVQQSVTPDNGYTGLSSVTVNPYVLDSKTVDASTVSQTITSDEDGLSSVTVNPYTTETDSSTLTANGQYVFTPTNADALSQVTIDVSVASQGGDYIYETKTGVRTSLTTDFAGLTNQAYGAYSLFNYCNTLESLTATMSTWGNTPGNKNYVMSRLCTGCENLESVSFPNWDGSSNAMGQFVESFSFCPKLVSVNFPEMTFAYGFDSAFYGSGDYNADASANFGKLERIGDQGMANCFCNSGFTSINMPLLETVLRRGLYGAFAGPDTSVSSMTFPSLTTCPNPNWSASDPSISSAFESAFANNPNITSVSFPELTTVGNQCFVGTFQNATGLTTLSMPKLSTFDKGSLSDAVPFRYSYQDNTANFLYGCTSLVNLTIHPNCLVYGILAGAPNITNLTITDDITDNVRLDWQSSLTAASVLSVLTNLDPSTSGKTVTFYTGGLIVFDDAQGSIQTAYDTAVNAGWTIDNLTIIPYVINDGTDLSSLGTDIPEDKLTGILNRLGSNGGTVTFANGSNYYAGSQNSDLYTAYSDALTRGWTITNLYVGYDSTGYLFPNGVKRRYDFDFGTGQKAAVMEMSFRGCNSNSDYMYLLGTGSVSDSNTYFDFQYGGSGSQQSWVKYKSSGSNMQDLIIQTNVNYQWPNTVYNTTFGVLDNGYIMWNPKNTSGGAIVATSPTSTSANGTANLQIPGGSTFNNYSSRSVYVPAALKIWHNWGTDAENRSSSATLVHDIQLTECSGYEAKFYDKVTGSWYGPTIVS